MIHAPSFKPHAASTLIYSRDPALKLPEDPAQREKALEVARETGKWGDLLPPGSNPTLFHVEYPIGTRLNYLLGQIVRRNMTTMEAATLALRVSLVKIEGFGDHKVERIVDPDHGETLTSKDIINAIFAETGEHGAAIVLELGDYIIERGRNPVRPK